MKKEKTDKRTMRRGGFYWIDDTPYVTVTTAMKSIAKPALRYWYGKCVWEAMVLDPGLSQQEALSAPWKSSKNAMGRGTMVHEIVETWKDTDEFLGEIASKYKPYAEAFKKWVDDYSVKVLINEKSVISKKHRFAGTFDLLVTIGHEKRPMIVDIKTGKAIYDDVFVQMSAYHKGLEEMGEIKNIKDIGVAVCNLDTGKDGKPTGGYTYKENGADFNVWKAAQTLWGFQNRELINKINSELPKKRQYPF